MSNTLKAMAEVVAIGTAAKYLPAEEHPEEVKLSRYYSNGIMMTLREALEPNDPENLYNWFRREYPKLNPEYYNIKNPVVEKLTQEYGGMSRDELIALCHSQQRELDQMRQLGF